MSQLLQGTALQKVQKADLEDETDLSVLKERPKTIIVLCRVLTKRDTRH